MLVSKMVHKRFVFTVHVAGKGAFQKSSATLFLPVVTVPVA